MPDRPYYERGPRTCGTGMRQAIRAALVALAQAMRRLRRAARSGRVSGDRHAEGVRVRPPRGTRKKRNGPARAGP